MRRCLSIAVCCALPGLFLLPGCASYTTPGGAVSMASLVGTDTDIAERMRRQPAAQFPARVHSGIALAAVQVVPESLDVRRQSCWKPFIRAEGSIHSVARFPS